MARVWETGDCYHDFRHQKSEMLETTTPAVAWVQAFGFSRVSWFVNCVSSSLLGPVGPSFRALSGRLKFTVRRHRFNEGSSSWNAGGVDPPGSHVARPLRPKYRPPFHASDSGGQWVQCRGARRRVSPLTLTHSRSLSLSLTLTHSLSLSLSFSLTHSHSHSNSLSLTLTQLGPFVSPLSYTCSR
jgi:hypothetical protein